MLPDSEDALGKDDMMISRGLVCSCFVKGFESENIFRNGVMKLLASPVFQQLLSQMKSSADFKI